MRVTEDVAEKMRGETAHAQREIYDRYVQRECGRDSERERDILKETRKRGKEREREETMLENQMTQTEEMDI